MINNRLIMGTTIVSGLDESEKYDGPVIEKSHNPRKILMALW